MANQKSNLKSQSSNNPGSSKGGKAHSASVRRAQDKSSGSATTMAELMASHTSAFISPKKGENLEGTITKLTSGEVLVDIGTKSPAVVLEKDARLLKNLIGSLKVGDKVLVYVLNPESDTGSTVVSLRGFMDKQVWQNLEELKKQKTKLQVTIDEITKGGFLVSAENGISGFLPNSHASYISGQSAVGQKLEAIIIELSRPLKKVIFSQKALVGGEAFAAAQKKFKRGQVAESSITNIAPFGIFTQIEFDGQRVEGFVHISEVSWEKFESVPQDFKPGDKIEAQILGFDRDAKRVNFSIKRLTKNPFEQKLKEFTPDTKVKGVISKILSSGIMVDLGGGIDGFIKKEKIPPTVKYSQGQSIEASVLEVDKNQRVILSPVLKEKPIGYR